MESTSVPFHTHQQPDHAPGRGHPHPGLAVQPGRNGEPGEATDPGQGTESGPGSLLAAARAAIQPTLRDAVGSLPPAMARIAAYHLGWCAADGNPLPATPGGGKAVRPALVLAAATAVGGDPADAVPAATAVELVHNFTLIHDDVMDRDLIRRHRPTVWSVFGVTDAILAGDALHALAQRVLAEDRRAVAATACGRLAACVAELCEGQHADCSFEQRDTVGLAECLAMAEAKTGALLGCACALGALSAGAEPATVSALDAFGREIGLAFQLVDDVIGIWGDSAVTGKPVGADLAARKKSLPVVAAATFDPAAAAEAWSALPVDRTATPAELRAAADALDRAGARDWAHRAAADHVAAALDHLAQAVPDPEATADLLTLAELVTRRDG